MARYVHDGVLEGLIGTASYAREQPMEVSGVMLRPMRVSDVLALSPAQPLRSLYTPDAEGKIHLATRPSEFPWLPSMLPCWCSIGCCTDQPCQTIVVNVQAQTIDVWSVGGLGGCFLINLLFPRHKQIRLDQVANIVLRDSGCKMQDSRTGLLDPFYYPSFLLKDKSTIRFADRTLLDESNASAVTLRPFYDMHKLLYCHDDWYELPRPEEHLMERDDTYTIPPSRIILLVVLLYCLFEVIWGYYSLHLFFGAFRSHDDDRTEHSLRSILSRGNW
ncbi:hypothetical protein B484DRAFT_472933 [Ochromonadaceae sp. CCMP2298]|nr:hypothetical protein B484DRAFT_472933 [Ochromonadaceae sp. CCMP2298]